MASVVAITLGSVAYAAYLNFWYQRAVKVNK